VWRTDRNARGPLLCGLRRRIGRDGGIVTINLFTVRPYDTEMIGQVIDRLMVDCDAGQVEHFLNDFTRWHRLQGHRASQRERDEAEVQLRQWQTYLDGLTGTEVEVLG
jgi:hypothetical protein